MNLMLNNVRLSFPCLFHAKAFAEGGVEKFSATALMDIPQHPFNIAQLEEKIKEIAAEKWGDNLPRSLKTCLHDGAEKEYAGYENCMYVGAGSPTRPTLVDRQATTITEQDGLLYGGCYVNMSINLWPQDNQFGKRINAQLRGVQFVSHGEPFGAKSMAADEFEELPDDLLS